MPPRCNGPLPNDGAPCAVMGVVKLCFLSGLTNIDVSRLESKPKEISNYKWWPYSQWDHASTRHRILRSVNFTVLPIRPLWPIQISHLVVEGLSQWVIGRNLTSKSDIMHYSSRRVLLPPLDGVRDSISSINDGLHSFIYLTWFLAFASASQHVALAHSTEAPQSSPTARHWS